MKKTWARVSHALCSWEALAQTHQLFLEKVGQKALLESYAFPKIRLHLILSRVKGVSIHQLLEKYAIETAEDIQNALKNLPGGTIKKMMEAEIDSHHGYEKSEHSDNDDYRNGYKLQLG